MKYIDKKVENDVFFGITTLDNTSYIYVISPN